MADLIDRDKLIDFIMESDPEWCIKPIRPIFDFITGMPSSDAVKIVRCEDCKFYHPTYCEIWSRFGTMQTREKGYCYMGERTIDDLINRQAAIEACLRYNGVGWVWSQIMDEIEKMPSAIVRCQNCYHYDEESEKCILNNSEMKPIDYCSYGSK